MTVPSVSAIVVNHRSAGEARECVSSLRAAFAREALDGEVVLVDCDSGPDEARALQEIPADARVLLAENRGYSGGVNAGVSRARSARLLLCNADLVFLPGAVTALVSAIEEPTVGAAAPLCLWDAGGRLMLPPESSAGFWGELAERHVGRFPSLDARRFGAFARRTLALWENGGDAGHLAGAVLAVRRDVMDRVGAFDERFLFEYEETEWEDRVLAAGLRLRYLPGARVRHLFARSASRNPDTERRRAASRRLYRETRYGRIARAILERPTRFRRGPRFAAVAEPAVSARPGAWLAVSTNPSLIPFAGAPLSEDFLLPDEVLASLRPGPVFLRVFDGGGRVLDTRVWQKP